MVNEDDRDRLPALNLSSCCVVELDEMRNVMNE